MRRVVAIQMNADSQMPRMSRMLHVRGRVGGNMRPSTELEMHFLSAGRCIFQTPHGSLLASAGDILFFASGDSYAMRADADARRSIFHCHFELGRTSVQLIEEGLSEWAHVTSLIDPSDTVISRSLYLPDHFRLIEHASIVDYCTRIMEEQHDRRPGHAIGAEAALLLLLRAVSDQVLRHLTAHRANLRLSRSQLHVKRSLQFINGRLSTQVSLFDLAEHLRINAAYLARVFRSHTGMTVGSYILGKKMAIAKASILNSRLTIKEIAASVGYSDALYFSRQFRKVEGMSPSEFMQWHSKDNFEGL